MGWPVTAGMNCGICTFKDSSYHKLDSVGFSGRT